MINILLGVHIFVGVIALLSAAVALSTEKGKKFHVLSGKSYFWATVLITPVIIWWNKKVLN